MNQTPNLPWPDTPDIATPNDLQKARHQAELDAVLEQYKAGIARSAASTESEVNKETAYRAYIDGVMTHIYTGYVDAAKEGIDRAQTRGELVQKAAAAIGTIYAAVLALSYAADATRLPVRGIVPGIFLGLAIVLSVAYLSFLTKPGPPETFEGTGDLAQSVNQQRDLFIKWCHEITLRRRALLQLSVLSLGMGVMLLPLPFLDIGENRSWEVTGAGSFVALCAWAIWYFRVDREK